jgi:hypothetical protein
MIGYILTPEQYQKIQGKFINPYCFINCVRDIDNVWFFFLSDQDKELLPSEYLYLLELPQGEYIPPLPPPFPF